MISPVLHHTIIRISEAIIGLPNRYSTGAIRWLPLIGPDPSKSKLRRILESHALSSLKQNYCLACFSFSRMNGRKLAHVGSIDEFKEELCLKMTPDVSVSIPTFVSLSCSQYINMH